MGMIMASCIFLSLIILFTAISIFIPDRYIDSFVRFLGGETE